MSRNANSRFSHLPNVDIGRSRFDRSTQHKTTFNAGELIPIFVDEVLPGDTFTMDVSQLVRMSTPIFPTMDNAYIDTYFFYVPNRLLWNHWKEFNGENTTSYWTQQTEYAIPQMTAPSKGWDKGSIADYMGIPTGVTGFSVSQLPFRAYVLIWNEWFRDQNTMQPAYLLTNDTIQQGRPRSSAPAGINYQLAFYGSKPLPVCKYHDYFTSCLPAPQKGPAVDIPMFAGDLPVTALETPHNLSSYPVGIVGNNGASLAGKPLYASTIQTGPNSSINGMAADVQATSSGSLTQANFTNLGVDLDNIVYGTINQLRQAFQIQKLYEKDARGGTRYTEILKAHFGVDSPDARQQRPEYLGGKRVPINVDQVLQTSETSATSPQGNTAAFSLTTDVSSAFTKSFTEHGYILGLACVRTDHTYQQGIERMWSRQRRFDFYWPSLANIGEQAVLKKELLCIGTTQDDEAFGYQEAWADYRYKPSRVSGAFRSNYAQTLDSWHYADYYDNDSALVLQADWMTETSVNIDRTLAVQSSVEDQFIADFYFKCICTRPMPLYSVPGLIDHH